jgi:two-component system, LytTR family, response regulator
MIRTVLVDDETDNLRILQRLLETYCSDISIVGTAEGVESALKLIRTTKPDLAFLDIEMIQGNAFDLLNQLLPLDFQVIFVTAFDEYALRAFKYSAVDYLLKPVDVDELRRAVDKVTARSGEKVDLSQIKTLLENVNAIQISQQKMALPTLTGLNFVTISDIIRLESQGHYTRIFLRNGVQLMTMRDVKEYEELLPQAIFYRVHNSHIINLQKIEKYQKGRGGYVIMEDGSSIEVASRRRQDFLQRLLK